MPDGSEIQSGFDGTTSWTIRKNAASLDKDTPVESARRDTDLQYALHQTDYFKSLELAGVTDFEGHHCYWLHGTTRWGKDNNQFYDVDMGLLAGYRFQADDGSGNVVIALFDDYKNFVGPLVATKNTSRSGDHSQTLIYKSISYDPIPDSTFDLPPSVKPLGWMRRPWRGCNVRNMNPEKAEALSPELQSALEPLLEEIESLSERIAEYNDRIEALAQKSYPQVELLKQIKGVGTLIARPSNSASCNQWLASASRA